MFLKVNSAMAGTLERKTSAAVPDGEMSSVETLSPSLIRTGARSVDSTGRPRGTSLMLGPRTTVMVAASLSGDGGRSPALDAVRVAGEGGGGGGARGRGGGVGPRAPGGGGGGGGREKDRAALLPPPPPEGAASGAAAPPPP